jgi:hypothetical protein
MVKIKKSTTAQYGSGQQHSGKRVLVLSRVKEIQVRRFLDGISRKLWNSPRVFLENL